MNKQSLQGELEMINEYMKLNVITSHQEMQITTI